MWGWTGLILGRRDWCDQIRDLVSPHPFSIAQDAKQTKASRERDFYLQVVARDPDLRNQPIAALSQENHVIVMYQYPKVRESRESAVTRE